MVQWWSHSCSKARTSWLLFLGTTFSLSTLGMILPFSIGMSSAVDGEIAPPINKTPLQYGCTWRKRVSLSKRSENLPFSDSGRMEMPGMHRLRTRLPSRTCQLTSKSPFTSSYPIALLTSWPEKNLVTRVPVAGKNGVAKDINSVPPPLQETNTAHAHQ